MEQYQQILFCETDMRILPGDSFSFDFEYTLEEHKDYRLFFTGEVDNFYFWKSEYCCTATYKRIDDSNSLPQKPLSPYKT